MNGYSFTIDCPYCAAELTQAAAGRSDGETAQAVAHCTTCGARYLITARLTVLDRPFTAARAGQLDAARHTRHSRKVAV